MMTHRLFVLFCSASATLLPASAVVAHEPKSAASVATSLSLTAKPAADVVDRFHAALKRGDIANAASLLAVDALIFESGGVERSKAEYASQHLAADAAFASATVHSRTRRSGSVVGEFAWIATEGKTTGTYKDNAINSTSTETMVLRRANGAWQIIHIHWSSAKAK